MYDVPEGHARDIVNQLAQAFVSGDYRSVDHLLDENIIFHFPGYNPFSGTFRGVNQVESLIARIGAHVRQHQYTVEVTNIFVGDRHVISTVRSGTLLEGGTTAWSQHVFHVFQHGRLLTGWVKPENLNVFDAYWSLSASRLPSARKVAQLVPVR